MTERQLLHLVIGGELAEVGGVKFRDLSRIEFVGAYPNYAEARKAWRTKAQASVDNALMRYFIIHAHKLIDPEQDKV
jgi:myo-inositol-1(or 4)-monophosphatase